MVGMVAADRLDEVRDLVDDDGGAGGPGPADGIGDGRYTGDPLADGFAPSYDQRLKGIEADPIYHDADNCVDPDHQHGRRKHNQEVVDDELLTAEALAQRGELL